MYTSHCARVLIAPVGRYEISCYIVVLELEDYEESDDTHRYGSYDTKSFILIFFLTLHRLHWRRLLLLLLLLLRLSLVNLILNHETTHEHQCKY